MKIALVTHTFFPYAYGGREKHVYDLAKTLVRRGNKVDIFTGSDSLFKCYTKKFSNLTIHYLPTIKIPMPGGYYRIMPTMLFSLLNSDIDIIHAHEYFHFTTFLSAIAAKIKKVPFILTEHGYPDQVGVPKTLLKVYHLLALPFILSSSKKIIAVSDFIREEVIKKFNISENKISVVYNGIILDDYKKKSDAFVENHNLKNKRIILSIGRLVKEKGFQYMISSMPNIIKKIPDAMYVIIGSDNYYGKNLVKLSKELGIEDKVIIAGPVSDEMLKSALYNADVFVIPSVYEPFGIIALEAMTYGKPIVSSKVGGLKEFLIDKKNCLLVNPANSKELANSIIRLLGDKKLPRRLGKNAKKDVKKYDYNIVIDKIINVYNKCLNEKV